MKRFLSILFSISLLISIFCSCAKTSDTGITAGTEHTSYTFTDDLDREVTVESYARTAALLGSYADIWIQAGGTICASADDAWDEFDLPLNEDTVNLGNTKNLSLEAVLSSDPDFILASTNTPQHLEWQSSLESAGITVAYFDVSDFDDYLRMLKICTDITQNTELYETYGTQIQTTVEEIISKSNKIMEENGAQTVLVMRASATSIRAKNSEDNVLGEALKSMGCINIADSDETLLENLSLENILLANPDKIFIVQSGDDEEGMKQNVKSTFEEQPLWLELDAVKDGNVYFMDKHLFNLKPNARWGEAYEQLEEILFSE